MSLHRCRLTIIITGSARATGEWRKQHTNVRVPSFYFVKYFRSSTHTFAFLTLTLQSQTKSQNVWCEKIKQKWGEYHFVPKVAWLVANPQMPVCMHSLPKNKLKCQIYLISHSHGFRCYVFTGTDKAAHKAANEKWTPIHQKEKCCKTGMGVSSCPSLIN